MNFLRQEEILKLLQQQGLVLISDLQKLYPNVTLMTIHRDLDKLQAQGYLVKVRGGARSVSHKTELIYEERSNENIAAKKIIAKKALSLIEANSCIFLDSGTTILEIVKQLPDINITIFTTAPTIALALRHLSNPTINLCGGNLNRQTLSLSGQNTLKTLEDINIDLAIIGVSGCSSDVGFTCGQESEMLVKQKAMERAKTTVAVFDSSKLNKLLPFTFAPATAFSYIITDEKLPKDFTVLLNNSNTKLL